MLETSTSIGKITADSTGIVTITGTDFKIATIKDGSTTSQTLSAYITANSSPTTDSTSVAALKPIINTDITKKFNIVKAEFTTAKALTTGDYLYVDLDGKINLDYVTHGMHFVKSDTTKFSLITSAILTSLDLQDVTSDFGVTETTVHIYKLLNAANADLATAATAQTYFTYYTATTSTTTYIE